VLPATGDVTIGFEIVHIGESNAYVDVGLLGGLSGQATGPMAVGHQYLITYSRTAGSITGASVARQGVILFTQTYDTPIHPLAAYMRLHGDVMITAPTINGTVVKEDGITDGGGVSYTTSGNLTLGTQATGTIFKAVYIANDGYSNRQP